MARLPLKESAYRKTTASHIARLVRARYPEDQYAVLYEVRDGTGFHAKRSADALAIGLWPSRGLEVEGFEFKVSRTDWLKELHSPEKAESIASYCDRWWVIVGDDKIIQPGELPAGWGQMIVNSEKDKLEIVSPAPAQKPIPLERLFVAAICRAAQAHSPGKEMIDRAVSEALHAQKKQYDEREEGRRQRQQSERSDLRDTIAAFQKASGVNINSYNAGQIGAAVDIVLNCSNGGTGFKVRIAQGVEHAAAALEHEAAKLRELAKLPAIREPLIKEGNDGKPVEHSGSDRQGQADAGAAGIDALS